MCCIDQLTESSNSESDHYKSLQIITKNPGKFT